MQKVSARSVKQASAQLELARLLRRAARAAARAYRERVVELDLTPRQAAAILALVEAPGVTLSALAEALGADQATASALVDRLLSAELVQRETDPDDRRKARLHPTEKALRQAERLSAARQSTETLIQHALGADDSRELARILARLVLGLDGASSAAARQEPRS